MLSIYMVGNKKLSSCFKTKHVVKLSHCSGFFCYKEIPRRPIWIILSEQLDYSQLHT